MDYRFCFFVKFHVMMCLFRILKLWHTKNSCFGRDVLHTIGYKCIHTNVRIFSLWIIFWALIWNATYNCKNNLQGGENDHRGWYMVKHIRYAKLMERKGFEKPIPHVLYRLTPSLDKLLLFKFCLLHNCCWSERSN